MTPKKKTKKFNFVGLQYNKDRSITEVYRDSNFTCRITYNPLYD